MTPNLSFEHGSKVLAFSREKLKRVSFEFEIPWKGGGDSRIQLSIGPEDWAQLLPVLAAKFPKELAVALTESAAIVRAGESEAEQAKVAS